MRASIAVLISILAASGGCAEGTACPAVLIPDTFTLELDNADWAPAHYTIEVSYSDQGKRVSYSCPVTVPVFAEDDAGSDDVGLADAGPVDAGPVDAGPVDAGPVGAGSLPADPSRIRCTKSGSVGLSVYGRVGRLIGLTFEDTPARVHLTLSRGDEQLIDRDLKLDYAHTYPIGRDCGVVLTALQRITF